MAGGRSVEQLGRHWGPSLNPFLEGWLRELAGSGLVLDIGSGTGFWLRHMRAEGIRAVGVEPLVERVRSSGGGAVAGDALGLPFPDDQFDVIWCIHVLHHLVDPRVALAEMARVLRPSGHLLLAETVEDNPFVRFARRVHPSWDGVPVRSRFDGPMVANLVEESGLEVIARRQHGIVSFAAWALPIRQVAAWRMLSRAEERLVPESMRRFGAHVEVIARAPPASHG